MTVQKFADHWAVMLFHEALAAIADVGCVAFHVLAFTESLQVILDILLRTRGIATRRVQFCIPMQLRDATEKEKPDCK